MWFHFYTVLLVANLACAGSLISAGNYGHAGVNLGAAMLMLFGMVEHRPGRS